MRGWYLVLALSACYQRASETACAISCPDGVCPSGMECGGNGLCHATGSSECPGGPADATTDTPGDGSAEHDGGPYCFGSGILRVCTPTLPQLDLMIAGGTQSTDSGGSPTACATGLTIAGTTNVCVILTRNLSISGTYTASGPVPLVLVATQTLRITGVVDVGSSTPTARRGAGAAQNCTAVTLASTSTGTGNAGNSGGTFGAAGGAGGPSNTINGGTASIPSTTFPDLTGGCPGNTGGNAGNSTGGAGGLGGGAIYLIAGGPLDITGTVRANGAGGGGGNPLAGGGGGGAGGYIGLDATTYAVQTGATLAAIGGGGGAGGGATAGPGGDESTTASNTGQAVPPTGGGTGGVGSSGAGGTGGAAGSITAMYGGGGGGGGGGGVIAVANLAAFSAPTATISPSPRQMP